MIDQLIQQLHDSDPNARRQAIIALGKSKDPAVLKPLAEVVRGDPVPALRELARKAGQYIRQQMQYETRPRVSPFTDTPPADTPLPEKNLSPATLRFQKLMEEERAKLEGALPEPDLVIDDDDDREDVGLHQPYKLYAEIIDEETVPETAEPPSASSVVRGRLYNVPKEDMTRAKQYLDAALSLNINGDNAKAMRNLTEALSLNPNLINDQYFNNVAGSVTGLDGDAAAQMIIDRKQRKQFTQAAARVQKDRRVEEHMSEAKTATWTDVWFEVVVYTLIVIIGPILVALVTGEMAKNLIGSFATTQGKLPEQLQTSQAAFTGLSGGALIPSGIVFGISGVVSLLFQTGIIHFSAKLLGGTGTWRHLVRVLLGFYNKWLPRYFLLLIISIAVAFISLFSPILLCFVIILVGMTLYLSLQTAGKIGEAYDFGMAKGCVTVLISLLVIGLINLAIAFVMGQTLSAAINAA